MGKYRKAGWGKAGILLLSFFSLGRIKVKSTVSYISLYHTVPWLWKSAWWRLCQRRKAILLRNARISANVIPCFLKVPNIIFRTIEVNCKLWSFRRQLFPPILHSCYVSCTVVNEAAKILQVKLTKDFLEAILAQSVTHTHRERMSEK